MVQTATREQAHELIDQIEPSQVAAAVDLLQQMLDPMAYALANAPYEDEEISEEEEQSRCSSKTRNDPAHQHG